MDFMIKSIDEAIDRKFLVVKTLKGQVELGTVIHVMDAKALSSGGVQVDYRVTDSGEKYSFRDYSSTFESLEQFCKWARPDNFIARHYEEFNFKDIQHYVKVSNRSFTTFCLPIMAVGFIIVWALAMLIIKGSIGAAVGVVASLAVFIIVMVTFKKAKTNAKMRLYQKVSTNWDVVIK